VRKRPAGTTVREAGRRRGHDTAFDISEGLAPERRHWQERIGSKKASCVTHSSTSPLAVAISPAIPRAALVTGGGRRLGRAIALALATSGFDIAVHCNASRSEAEATCGDIKQLGRRATVLQADLAVEAETGTLIPRATAALGPLGVLVNNASTFERDEWHDATRESWDRHIEPNLRAPFVLTQGFARALPATAEGAVINMIDERVWSLTPHFVSYTVSKVGLWGLTRSLALALAPRIRVNGIGPGPALPNSRQTQAQFERQAASVPLRRGPDLDEVGRAALMILSLGSMTGQMIALDGGQHLQWSPGPAVPADDE
jgi:NAD(P)-dependent dehydrogenase (short-subunit alcohol dehydrogenase family)